MEINDSLRKLDVTLYGNVEHLILRYSVLIKRSHMVPSLDTDTTGNEHVVFVCDVLNIHNVFVG